MKEPAEGDLSAPPPLDLEVIPTPKLCTRELADALSGLKPRERLFCEHYCAKGNATEAARLARTSDEARRFLDRLVAQGFLAKTEETPETGGPTKVRYQIPAPTSATNVINATNEEPVYAS